MSKSSKKSLLLVILAVSLTLVSGTLLNPIELVHAQGGGSFRYTLSNAGGITLAPGGSGFTIITATLTNGTKQNVILACDSTTLPPGASCSFTPAGVLPTSSGNSSKLTVTVPASTPYSSFNVTVNGNPATAVSTIFTLNVGATVAVNPTAAGGLNYAQKEVAVDVNITSAPPFSGFIVAVFFNSSATSVLQNPRLDYSGGALGNDAVVSTLCINSSGDQCIPDIRFDGQGVVSLALFTSSGTNASTSSGKLFSIIFSVNGAGFSFIHLLHQEVFTHHYTEESDLNTVGVDGYFANRECGAGNLCKPPLVSFRAPLRPVSGRPASLNGTAVSQNPNGVITKYNWTSASGLDVQRYNSPPAPGLKPSPNVTIVFPQIGQHIVTLSAQDNFGARAYYTVSVDVIKVWIDLGFASLSMDHIVGVIPGTVIHIVATAVNLGVNPENSTLRLSINNKNMTTAPVQNLEPEHESSLTFDWNTGTYTPRVYRIEADLDPVRNSTTGQILENDTTILQGRAVDLNNVRVAFVQLIDSVPGGFGVLLGLNLPETLGLGIVLIAFVVFAVGLVRKSRAPKLEPL